MSGHCCDHACDGHHSVTDTSELGVLYSLYTHIDSDRVECLNEAVEGSGKKVFKPWDERLNHELFVESDCDEELLFKIPYKNRPNMNFDDVNIEADQEFEIMRDPNGTLEYTIKIVKFSSVYHLTIHIPKNFGNETTKVYYIGLRGEFTSARREAILLTNYELAPNPAECKQDNKEQVPQQLGF